MKGWRVRRPHRQPRQSILMGNLLYGTIQHMDTITTKEYKGFQSAFDFFNRELFADSNLPNVLITLQRHARSKGYFAANKFSGRNVPETTAHELALNPDVFTGRTDEEILSTLAHEMCHLWQETHGKQQRPGYHDQQWAAKMESIGLIPSTTGEAGGKRTGQSVTHYIQNDGSFQTAYKRLAATGFVLDWQSIEISKSNKIQKRNSKTKFTCPDCGQNVWGKPDSIVACGMCSEDNVLVLLVPAA